MRKIVCIILFCCTLWAGQTDPYRLSTALKPTLQFIHLHLDPDNDDYSGTTRIELQITKELDSLNLHGKDFTIEQLTIHSGNSNLKSHFKFNRHGILTLLKEDTWLPGQYTIEFNFMGVFSKKGEGIIKYEKDGFNYLYTQMEDIYARQFFPCLDEPGFKFPYQLEIKSPKDYLVVSNTPEQNSTFNGENKTVLFEKTKPIPVYLLAFAVGPYETEAIPGLSVPGRIIVPKGYSGKSTYTKSIAAKILQALESYFGRPYPYKKLDFISASHYNFGAMENPGLVVYSDNVIIEADTLPLYKKYIIANDIAHELAHMWFGDLVTMNWWNDAWLNEGFATWIADEIVLQELPQLNSMSALYGNFKSSVSDDIDETSPPIVREVYGSDTPFSVFDALTYSKGQVVLRMLENWMGRDTFQKGLKIYFDRFAWKNSTSDDLFNCLQSVTEKPVKHMLQDFIMQAGVPLVSAKINENKIILSQERFKSVESDSSYQSSWIIPVNLKISDGKQVYHRQIVLDKLQAEFEFNDINTIEWIHLKDDVSGYYLTLLPLDVTIRALRSGQLTDTEIQDIFGGLKYGWQSGKVDPLEVLKLAYTFKDTENKSLIIGLADLLNNIRAALSHSIYPDMYSPYMTKTVLPMLNKMGYEVNLSFTSAEREAQTALLRCVDTNPEVLEKLKKLAEKYFDKKELSRDYLTHFRKLFYYGDSTLYKRVLQRISNTKNPEERTTLILALGNFSGSFVDKNLHYALSAEIEPNDRVIIPLFVRFMLDFQKYKLGIAPPVNILEWFKEHEDFYRANVSQEIFDLLVPLCVMDKEDMDTFNRLFSPEKRSKMMQKRLNRQIAKIMRWEKLIDLYVKKTKAYYQDF